MRLNNTWSSDTILKHVEDKDLSLVGYLDWGFVFWSILAEFGLWVS